MLLLKIKAFSLHLIISGIIVSLAFIFTALTWFPSPYLGITNFKEIAIIIIIVDLILGPLLTFIVFNPNKKSLTADLSIVASIQIIALAYGLYSLFLTHPVYITYHDNGFTIITAKQATPDKARYKALKISKLSSPITVYMNTDKDIRDKLFAETINGGQDVEAHAEHYEPLQNHIDSILKRSLDTAKIFDKKNITLPSQRFQAEYGNTKDDFAYIPIIGTSKDAIIVLNKKTAKIITTINTSPWEYVKK